MLGSELRVQGWRPLDARPTVIRHTNALLVTPRLGGHLKTGHGWTPTCTSRSVASGTRRGLRSAGAAPPAPKGVHQRALRDADHAPQPEPGRGESARVDQGADFFAYATESSRLARAPHPSGPAQDISTAQLRRPHSPSRPAPPNRPAGAVAARMKCTAEFKPGFSRGPLRVSSGRSSHGIPSAEICPSCNRFRGEPQRRCLGRSNSATWRIRVSARVRGRRVREPPNGRPRGVPSESSEPTAAFCTKSPADTRRYVPRMTRHGGEPPHFPSDRAREGSVNSGPLSCTSPLPVRVGLPVLHRC